MRQRFDGKSILAKDLDMKGSRGPGGKVLSQGNSRNIQRKKINGNERRLDINTGGLRADGSGFVFHSVMDN